MSSIPGNRVDPPVQWVRTTYDAYRRLAGTTSTRRGASQAAEVYVVQLSGDFARLDGSASGTGRRYRSTVVVVPSELPMSAAEDVRQSDQPLSLAALAPVNVFVLP